LFSLSPALPNPLAMKPTDAVAEPSAQSQSSPADVSAVPRRFNQWSLQIMPGGEFIFGAGYKAYGPNFRFAPWVHAWRGKFMVGGGPSIQYAYLIDQAPSGDYLHFFTVNGDLVIGGGKPDKIAAFAHVTGGLGVISAKDGQTGLKITTLGVRAAAGAGLFGFVHRMVSLGVLVDVGYLGGVGVDTYLTLGLHFGRKEK
jgi:hypothetical protein